MLIRGSAEDKNHNAWHFLSLPSIYKPSFISIPYVLFKIWPGHTSIMKKRLQGDNSINIQGRIMVLEHSTSSHCHLSISQVSFQSLMYFPRYGPDTHPIWKKRLQGDNSINIQGRIMVIEHSTSSHCHLSISQVSFQSLCTFKDMGRTHIHYENG